VLCRGICRSIHRLQTIGRDVKAVWPEEFEGIALIALYLTDRIRVVHITCCSRAFRLNIDHGKTVQKYHNVWTNVLSVAFKIELIRDNKLVVCWVIKIYELVISHLSSPRVFEVDTV